MLQSHPFSEKSCSGGELWLRADAREGRIQIGEGFEPDEFDAYRHPLHLVLGQPLFVSWSAQAIVRCHLLCML